MACSDLHFNGLDYFFFNFDFIKFIRLLFQGSELKYICGGSLISKTAILTAAHCVTIERTSNPINSESLLIYLGKFDLKKWTGPEEDVKVSEIIVNPQFNYDRFYADVAIIKFKSEVRITDYIRPVCLWNTNTDLKNIVNNTGTVSQSKAKHFKIY